MSVDNTIAIVQSKDGFRVEECQAIDNIYWHHTCCNNPCIEWINEEVKKYIEFYEKCLNCGKINPDIMKKEEINPKVLKDYFGHCKVFKTKEEAFEEAQRLYKEILEDDYLGIVEYGITTIYYDKEFPNG